MAQRDIVRRSAAWRVGALAMALLGAGALPAQAQFRPPMEAAVGEDYHVEASYGWWNATPGLIVNSESLGILGTDVNL
ncbi:MAG: hypothetical protein IT179_07470, partial [Acidobacteria bacterium]|nr:hypothetical protein [Acidobacteriota bacterium]